MTHLVFKSGRQSTIAWYHKQDEPRPFVVGISWITRSKEGGKRADEARCAVNLGDEDIFGKVSGKESVEACSMKESWCGDLT